MAVEWQTLTVDQIKANDDRAIAIGPFGSRMKANAYVEKGVPVIRGNNISDTRAFAEDFVFVSDKTADNLRSCNVFSGDLVFPHRGAIGQVGIIPNGGVPRYMLSTSLMKLTCNQTLVDPLFIFYFFRSPLGRHALLEHASTVGTPGIGQPLTSLRSIRVPVPPLNEQRAIAHILGTLDDKIELNRRMNETLEAMARAIFKSWFVDATENGTSKGWRVAAFPEVVEINPPRQLSKGQIAPYLDMQNMPTHGHHHIGWINRPFGSGMRFKNGDTLVARITPCLENGKTAFVDFLEDDQIGWGSTEYVVLRPKEPLPVEYGYYLARSEDFRNHAIQNMTGSSGRQRVPVQCFSKYLIAVPSEAVAHRFGELVKPLMETIRANDNQSRTLAAIRDALLPKLLSGEIRANEAKRFMTEVKNG